MSNILKFGEYKDETIENIPIDYLIWLFPKLMINKSMSILGYSDFDSFDTILKYFLTKNIKVKFENDKYNFYFIDHIIEKPFGGELEFMSSNWKGINTNGENVYEIIFKEFTELERTYFLVEHNTKLEISAEYVKQIYTIGERSMVYQKDKNYYFTDPYGKVYYGAYLMRESWVPEGVDKFSENIKINGS